MRNQNPAAIEGRDFKIRLEQSGLEPEEFKAQLSRRLRGIPEPSDPAEPVEPNNVD